MQTPAMSQIKTQFSLLKVFNWHFAEAFVEVHVFIDRNRPIALCPL